MLSANRTETVEKGFIKIMEVLKREKRSLDFLKINKEGNIDLILQNVDSRMAKAVCSRLSRKMERLFDGLKFFYSMATFPKDGKTQKTIIKKVSLSKK